MKKFFSAFCLFCLSHLIFAFSNVFDVPDSSEIRQNIFSTWLEAPISSLVQKKVAAFVSGAGQVFRVSCESREDFSGEVAVFVLPRKDDLTFDETCAGAWALFRDKISGEATKIVWRFQNDADVFLQIRAEGQKLRADFIVKGAYAAKGVPIGLSLAATAKMSFFDFYKATRHTLPWDYVMVSPDDYIASVKMISAIRQGLGDFGENVDSKEFVKWIVDSAIFSMGGGKIREDALLRPTVDTDEKKFAAAFQSAGCYECLDWNRNLAAVSVSFAAKRQFSHEQAGVDVQTSYLFSLVDENLAEIPAAYTKDSGFAAEILPAELFVVSALNPDYFFLAAVKSKTAEGFAFDDALALFPYFDEEEKFCVAAFCAGKEIDFAKFCAENAKKTIHLVGVKTLERFSPVAAY